MYFKIPTILNTYTALPTTKTAKRKRKKIKYQTQDGPYQLSNATKRNVKY